MLLRVKNKQLTNVSIVTLKKLDKKYEIAVYPNKIYEYRHDNQVPLNTIIHSDIIYKNISTGDVCSEVDLSYLQKFINKKDVINRTEIIHYILMNGYEQKAHETFTHELDQIEKQIVDMVQPKVTYNNSYVSTETLLGFIKKVWNIKNIDPKKQISGIIKKLEEIGFERVSFKVKVDDLDIVDFYKNCYLDNSEINYNEVMKKLALKGINYVDEFYIVKSDVLPEFIDYCESKHLKYVIGKNEEVVEEEIC